MTRATFALEAIGIDELTATDLHQEAAESTDAHAVAYRVMIHDEAEHAELLHLPGNGRTGIAWGADADWADSTGDIEQDVQMYLTDPERWALRN